MGRELINSHISKDLDLVISRDLVEDRVDNSLVRTETMEDRDRTVVLVDRTSSTMTTLVEDRITSEDPMITETTLVLHSEDSQGLLMMIMVLLDNSNREEITLEDRTASEDNKVTTLVLVLVSLKLLEMSMVHRVSLITLLVEVKTALEDSKIIMVLLVSLRLLVMIMVHLDSRVEITLEDNRMEITLEGNRIIILLVEHMVEINHRTLEDNKVTEILVSKEVTTLEANRVVTISEVKLPLTTDFLLKEFNLDRTIKEALLLVTKISVQLSILKML